MAAYISINLELVDLYGWRAAAIVSYIEYNSRKFGGEFYDSQAHVAEFVGLSRQKFCEKVNKLREAGVINYRTGYKPGTTELTTFWTTGCHQNVTGGVSPKCDRGMSPKGDILYIKEKNPTITTIGKAEAERSSSGATSTPSSITTISSAHSTRTDSSTPSYQNNSQLAQGLLTRIKLAYRTSISSKRKERIAAITSLLDNGYTPEDIVATAKELSSIKPKQLPDSDKLWAPDFLWFTDPTKTEKVSSRIDEYITRRERQRNTESEALSHRFTPLGIKKGEFLVEKGLFESLAEYQQCTDVELNKKLNTLPQKTYNEYEELH